MAPLSAKVTGSAPQVPCRNPESARAAILVMLLAIVAFIPAVHYGFVWDDTLLIQSNQFLQHDDSLWRFLRRDFSELTFGALGGSFYRPLFALTLWADAAVWGLQPFGFHLTNLLLHGLAIALLWLLVRRLSNGLTATLTSVLFAVHPAHGEVAVFISGRVESLLLIAMLGGLCLSLSLDRHQQLWRKAVLHLGVLAAALLALAAKESGVAFPGLLLAIGVFNPVGLGSPLRVRLRAALMQSAGALIIVGIYAALRFSMLTKYVAHTSGSTDIPTRMWMAAKAFACYTAQALLPLPFGPEWNAAIPDSPWNPSVLAGWTSMALVTCWLVWAWRRRPVAAFGLLWYLFALVPVLIAPPVSKAGEFVLAERWLYAPSAGMLLALGSTVQPWLVRRTRAAAARWVAGATLTWGAVALGSLFWITPIWANNTVFHRYILERNPDSPGPLMNVAVLELEAGRPEPAMPLLQHAVARAPADTRIWMNLGIALRQLKRYDEALQAFQKSMNLNPAWVLPPTFMGSVYYDTGRYIEGIALMQSIVRRAPRYAFGHFFLAVFHESAGHLDEAMTAYRDAIRLAPANLKAVRKLANIHVRMGSLGAAVETLEDGLAVSPGSPFLQMDLAEIYDRTGKSLKARALWKAVATQAADPELSRAATEKLAR